MEIPRDPLPVFSTVVVLLWKTLGVGLKSFELETHQPNPYGTFIQAARGGFFVAKSNVRQTQKNNKRANFLTKPTLNYSREPHLQKEKNHVPHLPYDPARPYLQFSIAVSKVTKIASRYQPTVQAGARARSIHRASGGKMAFPLD